MRFTIGGNTEPHAALLAHALHRSTTGRWADGVRRLISMKESVLQQWSNSPIALESCSTLSHDRRTTTMLYLGIDHGKETYEFETGYQIDRPR